MSENGITENTGSVINPKDWLNTYDRFTPSAEEFREFIEKMPKQGIGFRCDTANVAKIHKKIGLEKPDNNYWVLTPPIDVEPKSVINFQRILMDEFDYSLVLVDPWRDQEQIRTVGRVRFYSSYFKDFPDSRPAISWFTDQEDLFNKVNLDGEKVGDKVMGNVAKFGPVPQKSMGKPIILNPKDLQEIEKTTFSLLHKEGFEETEIIGRKEYRRIMWHMVSGIMLKELMNVIISA